MAAAREAAEAQRTERFTALDDDADASSGATVPEPPVLAPEPSPSHARRPGLETLFRFSAFDGEGAAEPPVLTPDIPAPAPPAPVSAPAPPPPPPPPPLASAAEPVPPPEIVSSTLAELYCSQGHLDKAIDVYRKLLRGGPENEKARVRLIELESLERKMREEAAVQGLPAEERRAAIQRQITRLEALLTVIRKES